jgi:stage V sporulation protein G
MEITEVKVFPIREEKLKAFVSIVFDGCFMVNDIKVIRGKDGLFISMPSRRKKSGEFKDVAHPLNSETRAEIESRVLDEYERMLADRGESPEVGRRYLESAPDEAEAPKQREQPEQQTRQESQKEREGEKSLEEVEEMHLRDSFWSVS